MSAEYDYYFRYKDANDIQDRLNAFLNRYNQFRKFMYF